MRSVAIGNGRNDDVSRVYGASTDKHIYEFSWSGSAWTKVDVDSSEDGLMLGVAVGNGRNDGVSRVYGANFDDHIYEFSYIINPTEFKASEISISSIHWQWTDNATTENSYYVGTSTYGRISPELGVNASSWTETGLSPNTQYSRCSEAWDLAGSVYSNIISSYTMANIPSDLIVSSRTATSITIEWDGDGTHYAIERSTNGSNWFYIIQWADDISTVFYTDSPISAHTTYWYRVQAYNGDKIITNPCMEISTSTLYSQPQAPTEVNINLPAGETKIKDNDTIIISGTAEPGTTCEIVVKDQAGRTLTSGIQTSNLNVGDDGKINVQVSLGKITENYPLATKIQVEISLIGPVGHKSTVAVSSFVVFKAVKEEVKLYDNLINPADGKPVTVRFELTSASHVTIKVYNRNGTLIKKIMDNQLMGAGVHTAEWLGKNISGNIVASGIYIIHIKTDSYSKILKAVVVK